MQQPCIRLPDAAVEQARLAAEAWAQQCRDEPLVHGETGVRVHVLGVCHFAPCQHAAMQQLVQKLQPAAVAIESPLLTSYIPSQGGMSIGAATPPGASEGQGRMAGVSEVRPTLLPYPPFVDALLGAWEELQGYGPSAAPAGAACPPAPHLANGAPSPSEEALSSEQGGVAEQAAGVAASGQLPALQQLREELLRGAFTARVGRDLLDPEELFG